MQRDWLSHARPAPFPFPLFFFSCNDLNMPFSNVGKITFAVLIIIFCLLKILFQETPENGSNSNKNGGQENAGTEEKVTVSVNVEEPVMWEFKWKNEDGKLHQSGKDILISFFFFSFLNGFFQGRMSTVRILVRRCWNGRNLNSLLLVSGAGTVNVQSSSCTVLKLFRSLHYVFRTFSSNNS